MSFYELVPRDLTAEVNSKMRLDKIFFINELSNLRDSISPASKQIDTIKRLVPAILFEDRRPTHQRFAGDIRQICGGIRQTQHFVRTLRMKIMKVRHVTMDVFQKSFKNTKNDRH